MDAPTDETKTPSRSASALTRGGERPLSRSNSRVIRVATPAAAAELEEALHEYPVVQVVKRRSKLIKKGFLARLFFPHYTSTRKTADGGEEMHKPGKPESGIRVADGEDKGVGLVRR